MSKPLEHGRVSMGKAWEHPIELALPHSGQEVWIEIGTLAIRVVRTDEGAICDIYDGKLLPEDMDAAHLTSTHALFTEAGGDDLLTHLEDVATQSEEQGPTRDDLLTHLEDVAAQSEEEQGPTRDDQ